MKRNRKAGKTARDFSLSDLSRREGQIMEILYRLERASAAEVLGEMTDKPGYSTIRKLLEILEKKGFVSHEVEGARYFYSPRIPQDKAGRSMLEGVVRNFFRGSPERAMEALLGMEDVKIDRKELDRLMAKVRDSRSRRG